MCNLLETNIFLHVSIAWKVYNIKLWSRFVYVQYSLFYMGQDGTVGTATYHGLDGPGIEFWWGPEFMHPPGLVLGSTQPPVEWILGLFLGVKQHRFGNNHPPPLRTKVKGRVELYLYSYTGLSWPVLGWTLPVPFIFTLHNFFYQCALSVGFGICGWRMSVKFLRTECSFLHHVKTSSGGWCNLLSHSRNPFPGIKWPQCKGGHCLFLLLRLSICVAIRYIWV
jgi:hypothetical protein